MGNKPNVNFNGHMRPLARLPVFFALEGRRCIVAGGHGAAAWKAELLSAAGAYVDVFAPDPAADVLTLAASPPAGVVVVHQRHWQPADFADTVLAVAECTDDAEAALFAAAARAAGVSVNVIDRPAFSDFAFAAIVNRSPLVIGISTDGAAPVFAQAIRAKIEALIPKGFARWAEAARAWRPRLQALALPFRGRRNFWERFTDRAVAAPNNAPTEADFAALLAPIPAAESGAVVLVGASPGDSELLTLRAVRALQSADVILFDESVSAALLDFARREAKKMLVGKAAQAPPGEADDAHSLAVALAKAGRRVVRLESGDPAMSSRAQERLSAACARAGITFSIVPGVSAAQPATNRREDAGEGEKPRSERARA